MSPVDIANVFNGLESPPEGSLNRRAFDIQAARQGSSQSQPHSHALKVFESGSHARKIPIGMAHVHAPTSRYVQDANEKTNLSK